MKLDPVHRMHRFNYFQGELDAAYHEAALKLGLSDSAMRILYTVCDNGECCLLQDICRHSGLSKQTINSALRKLEQDGIVYLEKVSAKSKNVCLTDAGKALAARTARRILELEDAVFSQWSEEDIQKYLYLTEKFLVDFKKNSAKL